MLDSHLESVLNNASDATRIVSYPPVGNATRGYDSGFAAALARKQGMVEIVTFAENVPGVPSPDDGTPVAEILGLNVHKFPKRDYASTERYPEAEFLACPPGWESPMGATENTLAGKLVIGGHHGGIILSTDRREMLPDLADRIVAGFSGATWEYRLRIGCLEFPLFYTGWQHAERVHDISTSTAMRPWSIGGDYDRPISRRFLEEAGVPRELFGQIKYAGAVEVFTSKDNFRPATWAYI